MERENQGQQAERSAWENKTGAFFRDHLDPSDVRTTRPHTTGKCLLICRKPAQRPVDGAVDDSVRFQVDRVLAKSMIAVGFWATGLAHVVQLLTSDMVARTAIQPRIKLANT